MTEIRSRQNRWSITLCTCSQDTVHLCYGNVVLHILQEDMRELGIAMQEIADRAEQEQAKRDPAAKNILVH